MPKLTKEGKKEEVATLAEMFKKTKAALFALYRGLSVRELTKLRRALAGQGIEFRVVKTSLVKRALEQEKLPVPGDEVLSQPVAVAFSGDEIASAKLLSEAAKETGKLGVLAGLIEGSLVDAAHLETLASLPSREELLGRLVGTLGNLPRRFVWAVKYPAVELANVLQKVNPEG